MWQSSVVRIDYDETELSVEEDEKKINQMFTTKQTWARKSEIFFFQSGEEKRTRLTRSSFTPRLMAACGRAEGIHGQARLEPQAINQKEL